MSAESYVEFAEACDSLDAMIFTGDKMENPEIRRELKQWILRWTRELDTYNDGPDITCRGFHG